VRPVETEYDNELSYCGIRKVRRKQRRDEIMNKQNETIEVNINPI
jgi:hypothetical protein